MLDPLTTLSKLPDFARVWLDFHSYEQTMWLVLCTGNDNIHELTSAKNYVLRIELADWEGNSRYAEYSNFEVASASGKYKLTSLGTYSGNAGTTIMSRYSLYLRFLNWEICPLATTSVLIDFSRKQLSQLNVCWNNIYTMNHKNVPFYFWLWLWLILTDFYNFYIVIIMKKFYMRLW